ncbi:MAG: ammonium transporter [Firmicutes bacterium]|nr:ammonium transporter [Bacillota bacterium]
MYVPSAPYVSPGDTAWQLTAATLVGMMSVPGIAILYGGLVKRKWALNSVMMVLYAFAVVLLVWVLWGYNMGFGSPARLGPGILSNLVGRPGPVLGSAAEIGRARIPLLQGALPPLRFGGSALIYFQFVFAGISPVILAGAVLGRMNFKAWMLFVPLWSTFVYSVNAFMLWGGGWLAQLGAVDYSGGYVIHVAAGVSGYVAAAVVGPRLAADREHFPPNNLIMALAGAGILWLGWNGFNGGDPYFANADAAAAVLNTNLAAAGALLTWLFLDVFSQGQASLVGAMNGMIAGLVAITPAAGFVNGTGAIAIGLLSGAVPWFTMNKLGSLSLFRKVDDTLGILHTHAIPGALGGLLTGVFADPRMLEYLGSKGTAAFAVTGALYGNPAQLEKQALALLVVVVYDALATFGLLKLVSLLVPLRLGESALLLGDQAVHGEVPAAPEGQPARTGALPVRE